MATSFPLSEAPKLASSLASSSSNYNNQNNNNNKQLDDKTAGKKKKIISFNFNPSIGMTSGYNLTTGNQNKYINFKSIDLEAEGSGGESSELDFTDGNERGNQDQGVQKQQATKSKTHNIQSRGLELDYKSWLPSILFTILALLLIFICTYLLSICLPEDFFSNLPADVDSELLNEEEDLGEPMDLNERWGNRVLAISSCTNLRRKEKLAGLFYYWRRTVQEKKKKKARRLKCQSQS